MSTLRRSWRFLALCEFPDYPHKSQYAPGLYVDGLDKPVFVFRQWPVDREVVDGEREDIVMSFTRLVRYGTIILDKWVDEPPKRIKKAIYGGVK